MYSFGSNPLVIRPNQYQLIKEQVMDNYKSETPILDVSNLSKTDFVGSLILFTPKNVRPLLINSDLTELSLYTKLDSIHIDEFPLEKSSLYELDEGFYAQTIELYNSIAIPPIFFTALDHYDIDIDITLVISNFTRFNDIEKFLTYTTAIKTTLLNGIEVDIDYLANYNFSNVDILQIKYIFSLFENGYTDSFLFYEVKLEPLYVRKIDLTELTTEDSLDDVTITNLGTYYYNLNSLSELVTNVIVYSIPSRLTTIDSLYLIE